MNGYEIKPTIEPQNKYEKARQDILQALNSIQKLTPQEQQQLAYELLGVNAVNSFIALINQINR